MQIPKFQVATHTKFGAPIWVWDCPRAEVKARPRAENRQAIAIAKSTNSLRTGTSYGTFWTVGTALLR